MMVSASISVLSWQGVLVMLSFMIVLSFVIIWTMKDGELPATVSDAAYSHTSIWRRLPYTLWIWGATFTLTPALFGLIPEAWEGAAHVYATAMVLTGILPLVRKDRDLLFIMSALAAGVFSQCCVCVLCPWFMLVWSHIAVLLVFSDPSDSVSCWVCRKGVFLAEFVCWFNIAASLLTVLIISK